MITSSVHIIELSTVLFHICNIVVFVINSPVKSPVNFLGESTGQPIFVLCETFDDQIEKPGVDLRVTVVSSSSTH